MSDTNFAFSREANCYHTSKMAESDMPEELMARFEELKALEAEFEDAELEISK